MNKKEFFGEVRWCEEDLANALEVNNFKPTEEAIAKIREAVDSHWFTDLMIEYGWEIIYTIINNESENLEAL